MNPPRSATLRFGGQAARRFQGVFADFEDLRDQIYQPSLGILPAALWPDVTRLFKIDETVATPIFGVRQQLPERCAGYALAAVVDIQRRLQRSPDAQPKPAETASATMLYHMARFHDAYRDSQNQTFDPSGLPEGVRTLRSAIKAFHHHGACLTCGHGKWPDPLEDRPEPDEQTFPNDQQAVAAEGITLGAYFRLAPVLNHYHSALCETGSLLVSARIHAGWSDREIDKAGGVITRDLVADDAADLYDGDQLHAFVILGYTELGFLVLNSWGPTWGNYVVPGEEGAANDYAGKALPGIALWPYADWAHSVIDGWVLRMGAAGPGAFAYSIGEQGYKRNFARLMNGGAVGATLHRSLRNQFLHLEDGLPVERGPYATPAKEIDRIIDAFLNSVPSETDQTRGTVIRIPSVMESISDAVERSLTARTALEAQGLRIFTTFWCSDLADEIMDVIVAVSDKARSQAGGDPDQTRRVTEAAVRGAGRAFWRDIERGARSAVFDRELVQRAWRNAGGITMRPGVLAHVFRRILAEDGPVHVVAEGAGALVFDELLHLYDRLGEPVPALNGLTLVFPAIPVGQTHDRLLPLIRDMNRAARNREALPARVVVPSRPLQERLSVGPYEASSLHLVANAFLDRLPVPGARTSDGKGPAKTHPQLLLGMSEAAREKVLREAIFTPDEVDMGYADWLGEIPDAFETVPEKDVGGGEAGRIQEGSLSTAPALNRRIMDLVLETFR